MAIPVRDSVPVRRTPWVTYLLIAANVVIFLFTPVARIAGVETVNLDSRCEIEEFYDRYAAIPQEMLHNRQLPDAATGEVSVGERGAGCVIGPPEYVKIPVLSVLTAMFLHGSWLHLLGNMLFLWVFGNNIEDRLGRPRYLLFYLLCGYIAAYGFALANPDSVEALVGASGAISGVLGAYLVFYPRARITSLVPVLLFLPVRLPAWLVLGIWFAVQWLYSAGYANTDGGSVAYLAHALGFVTGVLVAIPIRKQRHTHRRASHTDDLAAAILQRPDDPDMGVSPGSAAAQGECSTYWHYLRSLPEGASGLLIKPQNRCRQALGDQAVQVKGSGAATS